jgi:hypothetical protein
MAPRGPFKLVTVNTAPQRGKVLNGKVCEVLKEEYTIGYVVNCTSEYSCWEKKLSY